MLDFAIDCQLWKIQQELIGRDVMLTPNAVMACHNVVDSALETVQT